MRKQAFYVLGNDNVRAQKGHRTIGVLHCGKRTKTRRIPETMVGRILCLCGLLGP